jgi:hydroxyacylglutathione hydrolase
MVLERSMHPQFLSNTYLVGREGGEAFFLDAGGPVAPLLAAAERDALTPTHVLVTHHHGDHVADLGVLTERWPGLEVLAHPDEPVEGATGPLVPGEPLWVAGFDAEVLHTPGHTKGMTAILTEGNVFVGDTLFKVSVGGVRAPGSTGYADLKRSIMDVLMKLPPETIVRPGHTEPMTVADSWESNPFIRVWRGLDPEAAEPCTAMGEPAKLVLWAPDYDGGHKAWVRWPDGRDDIVPGSQVERF